jgi:hypothetical protein
MIVETRPSDFLATGDAATALAERTAFVDRIASHIPELPGRAQP